jgi:hypothetical protein
MSVTLVFFITRYDLQHGIHGVFDRLGVHAFFLCFEMMLFLVELIDDHA